MCRNAVDSLGFDNPAIHCPLHTSPHGETLEHCLILKFSAGRQQGPWPTRWAEKDVCDRVCYAFSEKSELDNNVNIISALHDLKLYNDI